MKIILFISVLVFMSQVFAATTESIKIKTPRGVEVEAVIHYPDAVEPVPAIVIGSGQGYHMDRPLIKSLAQKITNKGYVAIRFNWHYHTTGGSPSAGLKNELQDFTAVVDFIKQNSKIDHSKIIVAGKSLGTLVSSQYFDLDQTVTALILMTPVCTWYWDDKGNELSSPVSVAKENYPNILRSVRPVVVVLGNKDRLCQVPMLYDYLKTSSGTVSTVVVAGDHGMNIGPWNDPAFKVRNAENVNAATDMISHWVRLIVNSL